MKLPELTPSEQESLLAAITNGYGPCTCRPVNGRPMLCPGHQFLAETQAFGVDRAIISRVERMTLTRREAHFWQAQEFCRPFTLHPAPEEPLPPDLFGPATPEPSRESPVQGDDNSTLPW